MKFKNYLSEASDATKLKCMECEKEFKKKIGKNTYEVKCPKCGSYDIDLRENHKLSENAVITSGKGKGNPRWEYYDSRGVKHYGWVEKSMDHGGTDVTYFFRDEDSNELSVVSGSNLKKANRIWK